VIARGNPVNRHLALAISVICSVIVDAQTSGIAKPGSLPRFEDYPVSEKWNGTPAPVMLTTPAERTYRTRISNAAKEPANFAVIIASRFGAAVQTAFPVQSST
jgi:hypothetical protein